MPRLLLTGGRQRTSRLFRLDEWHNYDLALLVELDTESGASTIRLAHQTPPHLCPDTNPSIVFKAGALDGENLLLCTQTEILVVDVASMKMQRRISHPWFNDIHHVVRLHGKIHVVSTGLDALIVMDDWGNVLQVLDALEGDTWQHFDKSTDYRLVSTTQPHRSHPNYVFQVGSKTWVTRFRQGDAICLLGGKGTIKVAHERIHDGCFHEGSVWFTSVDGHVIKTDPSTGRVLDDFDLNSMDDRDLPLGWCRSIHFHEGLAYVGFSRVRPTKIKQNLAWLRKPLNNPESLPTRVAVYDLVAGRMLLEWDLEHLGMNAIFSILAHPLD